MINRKGAHWMALALLCTSFLGLSRLYARTYAIQSEDRFERVIRRNSLVIVLFYAEDRELRKDRSLRNKIRDLKKVFEQTSSRRFYRDADLQFVSINTAFQEGSLIAQKFNIPTSPAIIILNNGEPVDAMKGKRALLKGIPTQATLNQFINQHLSDELQDAVDQKERDRERRRSNSGFSFSVGYGGYPYGYYPGYWPYYGYYGYGYPYAGYGLGWYW